jgi:hypothetical protein
VDPFDDEVDLVESVIVRFDVFVFEALQIEFFEVITLLNSRLKLCISELVIEGVKPFALKQMVDSLTSFAAEIVFFPRMFFGDHDRLIELQVAVGTGDLSQ